MDFKFCNDDRKCWKLLDSVGFGPCQLLIWLYVIVTLERGMKNLYPHLTYSVCWLVVPERDSSRFAFQVQSDGTIAAIFLFLFGGIDISSINVANWQTLPFVYRSLPVCVVTWFLCPFYWSYLFSIPSPFLYQSLRWCLVSHFRSILSAWNWQQKSEDPTGKNTRTAR
jgi:hypothetical protein